MATNTTAEIARQESKDIIQKCNDILAKIDPAEAESEGNHATRTSQQQNKKALERTKASESSTGKEKVRWNKPAEKPGAVHADGRTGSDESAITRKITAAAAVGGTGTSSEKNTPPSAPAKKRAAAGKENNLGHNVVINDDGLVAMPDSPVAVRKSVELDDTQKSKIAANTQAMNDANAKLKNNKLLPAAATREEDIVSDFLMNLEDSPSSTKPGAKAVAGTEEDNDVVTEVDTEVEEIQEPIAITATAVTTEDLEAQVRHEILNAACTASHVEIVQPKHEQDRSSTSKNRTFLLLAAICMCLFLIVGGIVGVLVGTSSGNNNITISSDSKPAPPPPNNSDSPSPVTPTPAPANGPTAPAAPTVPVDANGNPLTEEEADALLLLDFLIENAPNQKATDALIDESSTRYEAYLWLVQDTAQAATVREDYQLLQRFALANLYYSMRGPEWSRNDGWLSGASICEWFGAVCADNPMDYLVRLDLSNNSLQGQLTPELVFLQKLKHLDLSDNRIDGKLPKALSNITSIGRFCIRVWLFAALSNCQVVGSFDSHISSLCCTPRPFRVSYSFI
jgi:uncharacterized membrane protein